MKENHRTLALLAVAVFMVSACFIAVVPTDESNASVTTSTSYEVTFKEPREQTLIDEDDVESGVFRIEYDSKYWWVEARNCDTYYDGVMIKIHNNTPGSYAYMGFYTDQFDDDSFRQATGSFGLTPGTHVFELYMSNEEYNSHGNLTLSNDPADGSTILEFEFTVGEVTSYNYTTSATFNANGGTNAPTKLSESETIMGGSSKTVDLGVPDREPTRDGFKFRGWSTTSGGDVVYAPGANITTQIGNDLTLYAQWEEESAVVTFMSNGSVYQQSPVKLGSTVTAPTDPELYGYTFQGWFVDDVTFQTPYNFSNPVNGNITLFAKWEGDLEFTTKPTAEMNVTPVEGQPGTVLFDASGSSDYKTVLWDFGDGTEPSTNTYVTHYYSQPGTYTATLTVYNENGSDTTEYIIEVPEDGAMGGGGQ